MKQARSSVAEPRLHGTVTTIRAQSTHPLWCPRCAGPTARYTTTVRGWHAARCEDGDCGFTWEVAAE